MIRQKNIAQIEVAPEQVPNTELLTYSFTLVTKTSANLNLCWADQQISIPMETNTQEQTLEEIDQATKAASEHWYVFSAAAQYHFYERKAAEPALKYINSAIALNAPNPAPWMLKSQILASQKKYQEAIIVAEEAIEVSEKYNFFFEVEENEENIKRWRSK